VTVVPVFLSGLAFSDRTSTARGLGFSSGLPVVDPRLTRTRWKDGTDGAYPQITQIFADSKYIRRKQSAKICQIFGSDLPQPLGREQRCAAFVRFEDREVRLSIVTSTIVTPEPKQNRNRG
jgi:hypothetical protein